MRYPISRLFVKNGSVYALCPDDYETDADYVGDDLRKAVDQVNRYCLEQAELAQKALAKAAAWQEALVSFGEETLKLAIEYADEASGLLVLHDCLREIESGGTLHTDEGDYLANGIRGASLMGMRSEDVKKKILGLASLADDKSGVDRVWEILSKQGILEDPREIVKLLNQGGRR